MTKEAHTATTVEGTLAERGSRYGAFEDHAKIAQALQDDMRAHPGWKKLRGDQKQALTTIADKIARILNGDPDYLDNWHDIQGYAKLVEDRLRRDAEREANGPELPLAVDPTPPRYREFADTAGQRISNKLAERLAEMRDRTKPTMKPEGLSYDPYD